MHDVNMIAQPRVRTLDTRSVADLSQMHPGPVVVADFSADQDIEIYIASLRQKDERGYAITCVVKGATTCGANHLNCPARLALCWSGSFPSSSVDDKLGATTTLTELSAWALYLIHLIFP